MKVSAEEAFLEIGEAPSLLCTPAIWPIIFPWLENSPCELSKFWRVYNTPATQSNRMDASFHFDGENRLKAAYALKVAKRIELEDEAAANHSRQLLGRYLSQLLMENPRGLKNLADEISGSRPAANSPSGPYSVNGMMLQSFGRFLSEKQRLPAKKELTDLAAMSVKRVGSRAMAELGLAGLPKAKPPR